MTGLREGVTERLAKIDVVLDQEDPSSRCGFVRDVLHGHLCFNVCAASVRLVIGAQPP